ncbi:helix-turn-helix domain-containing protein [Actinomadura syzygii]|uniref:Helix-turn-helix domain-containing protein n=1 Tax=Actinomadura syzygii TaxID=1427538 RepID=A0A5D0TVA8_9ACTN|nr:helix-turn-helix domain-containing protein [Actinomadura syzygii]TYC09255.1 helix-turn-helix domain-containing protein [Actinomadura syzygii]
MEDEPRSAAVNGPGLTSEQILARALRKIRMASEMSQEAVARHMVDKGHSWRQTTVAKTEAATRPIRVNEAASLARIFGVALSTLLDEADIGAEVHERLLVLEARRQKVLGRIESHKEMLKRDAEVLSSIEEELVEVRTLENEKPESRPRGKGK